MRVIALWDDEPGETELLELYLNMPPMEMTLVRSEAELDRALVEGGPWDAALLALSADDHDRCVSRFQAMRLSYPQLPIVGAAASDQVFRMARFLTGGLRGYVIRDERKDFLFLLRSAIEGAIESVRAEQERLIAEKLRQEVDSVRRLQASILPARLVDVPGYRISGRYEPAELRVIGGRPVTLAGGDYYSAFRAPDGSICLIVGDASGHGMKACLTIMTLHTLLTMLRTNCHTNTARFVAEVNRSVCSQDAVCGDGSFITLLYAVIQPKTGMIECTMAGHPSPLVQNLKTGLVQPLVADPDACLPLAIDDDAQYVSYRGKLTPGSRLLIYTDGLTEAHHDEILHERPGQWDEFGLGRTMDVMQQTNAQDPDSTIEALFQASHDHTRGAGRHDDTTILILDYLG